jgi:hypothetical protein
MRAPRGAGSAAQTGGAAAAVRRVAGLPLAVVLLTLSAPARADEAGSNDLSLGLRAGYALPFGSVAEGARLGDAISGMLPIWADVGYRPTASFFVGGYFQFAFPFFAAGACPSPHTCSGHDLRFGAQARYAFLVDGSVVPWLGAGFGYEILDTSVSETGSEPLTNSTGGFEFLVQAGADYWFNPNLALGPFVAMSFAEFSTTSFGSIEDKSVHEWLTFGVRGEYDISL